MTTKARCACGAVTIDLEGEPLTSVVCYCDDCQEAGRRIESEPGAQRVCEPDGGTAYLLYRRDRVTLPTGDPRLVARKLRPESPTNRFVATCCGSAMLLGFDRDKLWWVDVYRARVGEGAPPARMLVCTRFRQPSTALASSDALPSYPGHAPHLIVRLLVARIAMAFAAIVRPRRTARPSA